MIKKSLYTLPFNLCNPCKCMLFVLFCLCVCLLFVCYAECSVILKIFNFKSINQLMRYILKKFHAIILEYNLIQMF